jgi:hypothetical protein
MSHGITPHTSFFLNKKFPNINIHTKPNTSIIYTFGQHMELPRSPKIARNSHINQRKKKEKLHTTAILKKLD